MRFIKNRPMVKFKRIIAVGALFVVSWVATGAMNNAYADWSATTNSNAWFWCKANCQAGGVGPVRDANVVEPPQIGAWQRTVLIRCKLDSAARPGYYVTVRDKNWAGEWMVLKSNLTRAINDSSFPVC